MPGAASLVMTVGKRKYRQHNKRDEGGEKWRMFIAIALPESVKLELAAWQRTLSPAFENRQIGWTNAMAIHLTLKFLGDTPVDRIDDIKQQVGEAIADMGPISFVCAGTGVFPSPMSPKVLWAGVRVHDGQLYETQKRIEQACVPLGFPADKRRYAPHLTLGRIKNMNLDDYSKLQVNIEEPEFGAWEANEVILYRSFLDPGGAIHIAEHTWELGG